MGWEIARDDSLTAESIAAYLVGDTEQTPLNAGQKTIFVYESVVSTNDMAKELAADGAPAGTAVVANRQTAGRGRMGRSFYSPPDSGVYLSVILRPKLTGSRILLLTTGAAVAAAEAVEESCGARMQIKWVNDLYLGGKKIAGILTEAVGGAYIVGIGVNVKESGEGFPAELAGKAGALDAGGAQVSRSRLAAALIEGVRRMGKDLEEGGGHYTGRLIEEARKRSCVLGREVQITGAEGLSAARAVDIDDQGFLIVEDSRGRRHTLSSGEISLFVK
ncbi:MAG: biotin--[acetyl-CoA-carboxylase] ligase [Clostridiales bacterium]|nr:biotin--[acetyl-CoA-carboxylase] ligase [Clostridiales bacterium]